MIEQKSVLSKVLRLSDCVVVDVAVCNLTLRKHREILPAFCHAFEVFGASEKGADSSLVADLDPFERRIDVFEQSFETDLRNEFGRHKRRRAVYGVFFDDSVAEIVVCIVLKIEHIVQHIPVCKPKSVEVAD